MSQRFLLSAAALLFAGVAFAETSAADESFPPSAAQIDESDADRTPPLEPSHSVDVRRYQYFHAQRLVFDTATGALWSIDSGRRLFAPPAADEASDASEDWTRTARSAGNGEPARSILEPTTMLGAPHVLRELGVSDEQREQIAAFIAESRQRRRDAVQLASAQTDDQLLATRDARRDAAREQVLDMQRRLDAMLTSAQRERLRQLRIQWLGVDMLRFENVTGDLDLSADQLARLRQLSAAMAAEREDITKHSRSEINRIAVREDLAELHNKYTERSLAVLTPAQQSTFAAMQGEPFEFPPDDPLPTRRQLLDGRRTQDPPADGRQPTGD